MLGSGTSTASVRFHSDPPTSTTHPPQAAAFPATLPAKNWTSVLPTSLSTYNKTNPANAWPAPRFLGSAVTNATLTKLKAKVNVTGYP